MREYAPFVARGIEVYRKELEDENAHNDDALRAALLAALTEFAQARAAERDRLERAEADARSAAHLQIMEHRRIYGRTPRWRWRQRARMRRELDRAEQLWDQGAWWPIADWTFHG